MAEQQLVDYIKKAREAGQADSQTRNLLYKNGWTEAEVNDAFGTTVQAQPKIADLPEDKPEPKIVAQQQPQTQPQVQVNVQSQITPAVSQDNVFHKKAKSHLVIKLLMVFIILVVICGAGYSVAGQYISLPYSSILFDLFAPSPATVISKMTANMGSIKSSHVVMQGEIDATDSKNVSQGKMSFTAIGESDITDANNPKSDITFTISALTPTNDKISANVSMAVIAGALYFKFNNITVPNGFSYSGLDVSQINGKWFKFDQDSAKALSQVGGGQTTTINISQTNSSALVKEVRDLISAENMLSFTKQLGSEVVSGHSTYHYLVTISNAKLQDLMNKIIALEMQQAAGTQANGVAGSSNALAQNMAQAFVKTFADALGDINIEMWIGKDDFMLYRAKLDKAVNLSKISSGINAQIEVKFDATYSNFNKIITVQAPAGAQKIEDVALPLLKTQKIKSDMQEILFLAAGLNGNYSSLCSRGLLNGYLANYGTSLISLNNDIVSQGGGKPACFSVAQNYCISTQLTNGSYLCVGGTGATGTVKCLSAQTVCK